MVAGIDRYFQIARCFRDEDLRGDRQPEFTQLDLEMSFVDEETVMGFVEAMVIEVSARDRPRTGRSSRSPFPRFTYDEAMERFGTDKPDLRFGMELVDLGATLVDDAGQPASGFRVFDERSRPAAGSRRSSRPGMGGATRRRSTSSTERARRFGAKGLVHLAAEADGAPRPIVKFVGRTGATGSSPRSAPRRAISSSSWPTRRRSTADVLGRLRSSSGERLGLADPDVLAYCWVHRFPMYQWDAEARRWDATHNPFSGVVPEDVDLLTTISGNLGEASPDDPAGRARALQYDLALNGWELGGGSIRIHRRELLERSFALQGQTADGMRAKFGAVLDAFEYGAPPHGGIALGIDRWAMILSRQTNIREVMAFPKTQSGTDLMLEAPSAPEPDQLAELGLRFVGAPGRADSPSRP